MDKIVGICAVNEHVSIMMNRDLGEVEAMKHSAPTRHGRNAANLQPAMTRGVRTFSMLNGMSQQLRYD